MQKVNQEEMTVFASAELAVAADKKELIYKQFPAKFAKLQAKAPRSAHKLAEITGYP